METAIRIGNRVKQTHETRLELISGMEIDAKVELIQELIPLGLMHVAEELKKEVERLACPRPVPGVGNQSEDNQQNRVDPLPHGLPHRLGGLLEGLQPAATVGGHRIAGHRTRAEKDPGVSPSAGTASCAPGGVELALEPRRETGVAHHGRFVNFN